MKTHRFELTPCPTCGYTMDSASSLNPDDAAHPPTPGDYSVCFECGELLEFDADLKFRKLDIERCHPVLLEGLLQLRRRLLQFNKRHPRPPRK